MSSICPQPTSHHSPRRARSAAVALTCALLVGPLWLAPGQAEAGFLSRLFGRGSTSLRTTDLSPREQQAHWELRRGNRPSLVRRLFRLDNNGEARVRSADPANTRWNRDRQQYEHHDQWKRRVR